MIKNLAQLKRKLQVGSEYQLVENALKPERNGEIRTITRVQTNSIIHENNGKEWFLDWQKAKNMRFNDDNTIEFLTGEKVRDKWLIDEQAKSGKDYWLKIKVL